ncbi:hypothetical protein [Clostridium akagii]|uniref:hypothetical protein n=1 Tax=Clostridium akagii TaxID=91623 RepID=UPI0012EBB592|nr:hypothetical protein [Clostridium akagii]
MMKVGSIVQLQDNNEWNGFYGVVKYIKGETAYVFCTLNPCYLYKVEKANQILLIDD